MLQRIRHNKRSVLRLLAFLALGLILQSGCGSEETDAVKLDAADSPLKSKADEQAADKSLADVVENKPALEKKAQLQSPKIAAKSNVATTAPSKEPGDLAKPGETQGDKNSEQAESSSAAKTYTDAQLHKNLTTLLLAYQPDVRARHLLKFVRGQLTHDQEDAALKLLLRNDYHFQRLVRKREDVLNAAVDGDNTLEKLRLVKIETFELSNNLRTLVYNEILTPEQKERRKKVIEEARVAKKLEAEKRKR